MTFLESIRRTFRVGTRTDDADTDTVAADAKAAQDEAATAVADVTPVAIAPDDPLLAVLESTTEAIDLASLALDSPAVDDLREQGVSLIVPLISQGELIGALYLGGRLSEQGYSTDDRRLLASLAGRAAPAIRVAQLAQAQAAEAAERERMEQEMSVATLIQQQFLPHRLPELPDWQVAAYYGPARAVGGDFYDFIELPEGRIGIVVGDVTDKGVPAALVMARTHSILRAEAPRLIDPGAVLARANELLCEEMPANMFVTCLYGVLEPASGHFRFANAGHNLPWVRAGSDVDEWRATGMPLGLLPGMDYEEADGTIGAGQSVLLYSDGFVEAHAADGEMYGFDRLRAAFGRDADGSQLVDELLEELHAFTGEGWEQEDDLTLVTLRRAAGATAFTTATGEAGRRLLTLDLPAETGNERRAMDAVTEAVSDLGLEPDRLDRLRTAVSEAAMNAIEHGSGADPDASIHIAASVADGRLQVRVADMGRGGAIPLGQSETPDLEAKLRGEQTPRGWGLFLIESMVDEVAVEPSDTGQAVVLTVDIEGGT